MPINLEKAIDVLKSSQKKALILLGSRDIVLGVIESKNLIAFGTARSAIDMNHLGRLEEILSPASCYDESTTVEELLDNLQENNIYVVRNHQGQCLGIVDPWLLLKYINQNQRDHTRAITISEETTNVLQQWPIPAMVQGENGEIIYYNPSWQEKLGNNLPLEILLLYKSSQFKTSQHLYRNQIDVLQDIPTLKESLSTTLFPNYLDFTALNIEKDWQFLYVPLGKENNNSCRLILAINKQIDQTTTELLQLNQAKNDLLASIGHELKSPLTTVVGLANLLMQEKIGELNARQKKYAESIYNSGRQLIKLVNNLLDLTHLEAGELKLVLRPVKIRQVCEQAYASIVAKYQSQGQSLIHFHLTIESGVEEIIADETRLHQMLVNLLDNAIKFTKEEGKCGLKVFQKENWLVLTVWDTGIGICEKSQPWLLQNLQPEKPQIGLGLLITQRLALLHGGDLSFVSEVNQGSQFTLLLPISQNTDTLVSRSLVLIADSTNQTIDPINQILRKAGYQVSMARTGPEALDKARLLKPAIIFLNPLLSILSGWDLLKLIKGDIATEKIKVIITATKSEEKLAHQMRADGFLSLPIKPIAVQKMLDQFNNTLIKNQEYINVLHLHNTDSPINLKSLLNNLQIETCILEADDLEQAELLAQVWKIHSIFLDLKKRENFSLSQYWQDLASSSLSTLSFVTLDTEVFNLGQNFPQVKITYGLDLGFR